jgi:hypothetical protein
VKAGRRKKSAEGNKSWDARFCAQALREALEIARQKPEPRFENPDSSIPNPDLSPKGRAACTLGVLLLDYCDHNEPAKFLRMVADELEGNLKHSPRDENIWRAFMLTDGNTWPEFRKHYEKLIGRKLTKHDKEIGTIFSIRRSLERITGFRLYKK